MKTLLILLPLALVLTNIASAFPPSNLTRCLMHGWDFRRVGSPEAFQFERTTSGCSAKFTIEPDDAQIHSGWRSEIEDPLRLKLENLTTHEFKTYIPEQLDRPDVPNLVFAQWHDNKKPGEGPAQRPPFSIRLRDGNIVMPLFNESVFAKQGMTGDGQILFSQRAQFNTWIQWRVRTFWTGKNNGSLEVWMDGKKVVSYRGPTTYGNDWTSPYFKLGIYTTKSFDRPLWVFHADYKRTHSYGFDLTPPPRKGGR